MSAWDFLTTGYTDPTHGRKVSSPLGAYGRGVVSTFLPIEPIETGMTKKQFLQRESDIKSFLLDPTSKPELAPGGAKPLSFIEKSTSSGMRRVGRPLLKGAFALAGPVFTAHRLSTEGIETFHQQGFGAGVSKTTRILGEEAAFAGGMAAGSAIGGKLGLAMGGGVGFVAGIAIGAVLGHYGGEAWNVAVDIAETPFTAAKYLGEQGRQGVKLELGGGISRGNRTRLAHTMRQRALLQMNRSGINARSLLGMESSMLHR
jgi:hypothetical protein